MISLLLQVDTAQVVESGFSADGVFFWEAVGAIVLVVCFGYLLRRLFKTEPAKSAALLPTVAPPTVKAVAPPPTVKAAKATDAAKPLQKNERERQAPAIKVGVAKAALLPVASADNEAPPVVKLAMPVETPDSILKKELQQPKAQDPLEELENRLGMGRRIAPAFPEPKPAGSASAHNAQKTPGNGQSGVGKTVTVAPPAVEKVSSTVKYIGYQPLVIPETGMFPKVLMPQAGCVIKFPRVGRSGRRGFKEADFMEVASSALSSGAVKVYNDRHVPTPNAQSPYEPDLVVLNELNGLNLFLNIEIDEPYDGVHRQPIHCQGEDNARDEFFTRRGWIVVRFAEIQVHQQPVACCAYVAKLIAKLDPDYKVPQALQGQVLQPVSYWHNVQAQKWAKANYRENYLGITGFGRREEQAGIQQAAALAVEEEVEKLVDKTATLPRLAPLAPGRLEKMHSHPRDARLQFDPEAHQYLIEGQPATAVSTLVDRFFPEFDRDRWAPHTAAKRGITTEAILAEWDLKGKTSAALGTRLHEHIEDFYDTGNTAINLPEFKQFLNFHGDHGHLNPHRTEWRVFNEEMMIAGTLDFVARHADGTVSIYDWKRSEKVIHTDGRIQQNGYQTQEGPLGDLDDSRFSRYSIQQNLYKWLLESKYDCRVRSMHLVVLHPTYNSYTVLEVPDRTRHVEKIIKSLQSSC